MTVRNIHVVCTGNTCRSPMAEGILRNELRQAGIDCLWSVSSSGLCAFPGDPAAPHALQILAEMGIDISSHRSSRTSAYAIEQASYVLAMTDLHRARLVRLFPEFNGRIRLFSDAAGMERQMPGRSDSRSGALLAERDIPDPYGGTLEDYRRVAEAIAYYARLWVHLVGNSGD